MKFVHYQSESGTHQRGMTLVELLVALAIGSFLIVGAVQVYNQSRQAFVINESIARVQETAQFAMDTVEADLRMASNWGLNSRGGAVEGRSLVGNANPLGLPAPAGCGADWALDLNRRALAIRRAAFGDEHAVVAQSRASLAALQLEYLDLYLIHQPYGDVFGAWRTLETLYRSGLAKAIGVSNFHPDRLMVLICHHSVVPAVNQVETHPFYQRRDDHAFMQDNRVQHQSWASFAEGRNNLFGHPVLTAVAARHGKSVAQVVLRWLIQRNIVVIPKSVNRERLAQNIDVFDFDLTPADMKQISTLDENESLFFSHRDPERVKWLSGLRLD